MDDKKDLDNLIIGLCNEIKADSQKKAHSCEDQQQNNDVIEKNKVGRKNKGYTLAEKAKYNEYRKELRNIPQNKEFNPEIIEKVKGDIIPSDDLTQFKELYHLTCMSVLDSFKSDNTELCKKHPYMWYKNLLIELKKNVPAVTYKDIDKLPIVWECLTELLNSIGLYITYEIFQTFTKIYDYQLKDSEAISPKYADFRKKILLDRDNALVNEIAMNPYNQTNKIFLAKVHGIIEKTEPKQIEVHHDIRNYDNLPMFSDGKN